MSNTILSVRWEIGDGSDLCFVVHTEEGLGRAVRVWRAHREVGRQVPMEKPRSSDTKGECSLAAICIPLL